MPTINCGNCGATHGSVAEVRECHRGSPTAIQEPLTAPQAASAPHPEPTKPAITGVGRGPAELGRCVLVLPGDAPPAPWADCRVVAIAPDAHTDQKLIDELHDVWLTREAVVFELEGPLPAPVSIDGVHLWDLDPSLELGADRFTFLLTANTVDARSGSTWAPLDAATELGADVDGDAGDIRLPDGTPAWIDGGPFGTAPEDGVVHSSTIEAGRLDRLGLDLATAELAPDQLRAVGHPGGPARVVAPAGSGKTRVLTERARLLLGSRKHPTQSLTLVAFNKRAQLEMQERTADLGGLRVRTLNALGLAVLRGTDGFQRSRAAGGSVDVITERDVRRILDGLLDLRRRANTDQLAPWLEALTAVRLGLRNPAEVERSFGGDVDGLPDLVRRYRSLLAEQGLVDFDEQIVRAIEVLLADPVARAAAQRTCRTMLVDEFQDLTPAHMLFIRLLAAPRFDVFGVGDDDQTIYGFTGARPDWLIDYRRWFPGAAEHALEVNYRCPPAVVEAASTLLTHNRFRVEKSIRPAPDRDHAPAAMHVSSSHDPIGAAAATVASRIDAGAAPNEIAVLTRVNASLAPIQVALMEAGIPTEKAVDDAFLARSGVAAVLAWLRLITGGPPFAAADIEAAARRPSRGISPRVVSWMAEQRDVANLQRLAQRIDKGSDKVEEFADDIEELAEAHAAGSSTGDLIESIRDDLGLARSLDALDSSRRSVDRSSHGDDLQALLALARLQPDPVAFEPWLRSHLASPGDPSGVRLATIHRVKGREWPHVLVLGADVGMLPHRLAEDIEEERRVFHVGITRASETTTVVCTAGSESRFVSQLDNARDPDAEPEPAVVARSRSAPRPAPKVDPGDPLRESLRKWRAQKAKEDAVPAYVVFNDRTLDDLVLRRPTDLASLGRCHGIGPAKLDRFGDELLGLLEP